MTRSRDLSAVQQNLGGAVPPFTAGKNAIINGDFGIWQRGTSYNLTTTQAYGSADRWGFWQDSSAAGVANQTTTVPTGFQYGLKIGRNNGATSANYISMRQAFETSYSLPFAGKTVTLSFYAKAGANYSAASSKFFAKVCSGTGTDQSMASMGTWTGYAETQGEFILTTSYQRFTMTATISSNATQIGVWLLFLPSGTAGADDNVYITGVQLEAGATATPFQTATGTKQGELAACQRYYWRLTSNGEYKSLGSAVTQSTTGAWGFVNFPVQMRIVPTSIEFSNLCYQDYLANIFTASNVTGNEISVTNSTIRMDITGATAGRGGRALTQNTSSAYLGFNAEL